MDDDDIDIDDPFFLSDEFLRASNALWHPVNNPNSKPGRAAVEAMLLQASGSQQDWDDETFLFMRDMAAGLLAAGGREASAHKTPAKRADDVLRATGLSGKYNPDTTLLEFLNDRAGFDDHDADGNVTAKWPPPIKAERMRQARAAGLIKDHVSDDTLRKKIERGNR